MVYCIRNKRCNNKLQATTRSNMADAVDPTTGCAKIKFTSTNEIERALPNLLADHHGGSSDKIMSVQSWNTFCDKVDDATNALRRVNTIQCIGWCLLLACFLLVLLMPWGDYVDDEDYSAIYTIIMIVLILLMIPLINTEHHTIQKVVSKVSQQCAAASNHHKDLTLTLKGFPSIHQNESCNCCCDCGGGKCNSNSNSNSNSDGDGDAWYIEVAVRNAVDIENQAMPVLIMATATAIAIATSEVDVMAEAEVVAVSSAVAVPAKASFE